MRRAPTSRYGYSGDAEKQGTGGDSCSSGSPTRTHLLPQRSRPPPLDLRGGGALLDPASPIAKGRAEHCSSPLPADSLAIHRRPGGEGWAQRASSLIQPGAESKAWTGQLRPSPQSPGAHPPQLPAAPRWNLRTLSRQEPWAARACKQWTGEG